VNNLEKIYLQQQLCALHTGAATVEYQAKVMSLRPWFNQGEAISWDCHAPFSPLRFEVASPLARNDILRLTAM